MGGSVGQVSQLANQEQTLGQIQQGVTNPNTTTPIVSAAAPSIATPMVNANQSTLVGNFQNPNAIQGMGWATGVPTPSVQAPLADVSVTPEVTASNPLDSQDINNKDKHWMKRWDHMQDRMERFQERGFVPEGFQNRYDTFQEKYNIPAAPLAAPVAGIIPPTII
jgi:hypothetical protein